MIFLLEYKTGLFFLFYQEKLFVPSLSTRICSRHSFSSFLEQAYILNVILLYMYRMYSSLRGTSSNPKSSLLTYVHIYIYIWGIIFSSFCCSFWVLHQFLFIFLFSFLLVHAWTRATSRVCIWSVM